MVYCILLVKLDIYIDGTEISINDFIRIAAYMLD